MSQFLWVADALTRHDCDIPCADVTFVAGAVMEYPPKLRHAERPAPRGDRPLGFRCWGQRCTAATVVLTTPLCTPVAVTVTTLMALAWAAVKEAVILPSMTSTVFD